MFKRTLLVLVGIGLTMQLAGCFYVGDDHRWHGGHREYHENHENHENHDPGVDVHFHS